MFADKGDMSINGTGINVAGTNAIGDYLVSKIANTRTLFGIATPAAAPPAPVPGGSGAAAAAPLTRSELQTQVQAQQAANTRILFGGSGGSAADQSTGALPSIPGQTAQQVAQVAIQSSNIAEEFSNIATLFGSLGLGTTTNTNA